jgi:hypothetical protein
MAFRVLNVVSMARLSREADRQQFLNRFFVPDSSHILATAPS